jgi:hypothetical protein
MSKLPCNMRRPPLAPLGNGILVNALGAFYESFHAVFRGSPRAAGRTQTLGELLVGQQLPYGCGQRYGIIRRHRQALKPVAGDTRNAGRQCGVHDRQACGHRFKLDNSKCFLRSDGRQGIEPCSMQMNLEIVAREFASQGDPVIDPELPRCLQQFATQRTLTHDDRRSVDLA